MKILLIETCDECCFCNTECGIRCIHKNLKKPHYLQRYLFHDQNDEVKIKIPKWFPLETYVEPTHSEDL